MADKTGIGKVNRRDFLNLMCQLGLININQLQDKKKKKVIVERKLTLGTLSQMHKIEEPKEEDPDEWQISRSSGSDIDLDEQDTEEEAELEEKEDKKEQVKDGEFVE